MKIAFISIKGIPYGGGIEKVTEEIGMRLVKRGHEVVVYCSRQYSKDYDNYKGMQIRRLSNLKHPNFQKVTLCLNSITHALMKDKVDIIHFHSIGALFSLFAKIKRVKNVAHIHSFEWRKEKWNALVKFFLSFSDKMSNYFSDTVVVASKPLKEYYDKKFRNKVVYLPNGVDVYQHAQPYLIRKYGLAKNDYFLYMGRLSNEKGVHYLIDAYNNLGTDKKLVLAGDFSYDESYNSYLRYKCYKSDNIILTGYVSGKLHQELFSNAHVCVFPSEVEGSPVALLEAMSYGNCCVVSDISENMEVLNGFGYTFRTKDAKDLEKVMRQLLSRPGLINRYKNAASKHVLENYTWDKITDQLERLYFSVLNNRT